jgi:hypothetical protein
MYVLSFHAQVACFHVVVCPRAEFVYVGLASVQNAMMGPLAKFPHAPWASVHNH